MDKKTFYIKGMHCSACVILVERCLKDFPGVKKTKVSLRKGTAEIVYEGKPPSLEQLNHEFKKEGYFFSENPEETLEVKPKRNIIKIIIVSASTILVFFLLNRLGLGALVNIQSQSSLPTFFVFGLFAGLTSCAALVGGIILSLSKQWLSLYSDKDSLSRKLRPHMMFYTGRLISYAVLGAVLGAIGSQIRLSFSFTAILVMAVSVIMLLLGLQMLGVKALRGFQIGAPKFITSRAIDESKFKGRYLPFLMGAFTFFLPCGFTIAAQGAALLSGSFLQGGLIMLFFALGTTLPLMMIGLAGIKFFSQPRFANTFLKVAGILVLFFALFNVNAQLNALGWPSLSNLTFKASSDAQASDDGFPPIISGKQVIKMNASASGYSPNYFKVKAGVPVRWEITDTGTSGCTNAVISRSLFDGEIALTPGKTSVKEFTPEKAGKYKFSCWMGMVNGTLEVVDKNSRANSEEASDVINASSGAGGSCGSSCGGCGGCGASN